MMQIKRQLQAVLLSKSILLLAAFNSGRTAYAATGSPPPPTDTKYEFTIIDIPNQQFMAPVGLNNRGMACGFYFDSAGHGHGFLWQNGSITPLDAPGWADTFATGINDLGVVTGNYDDLVTSHTFLYRVHHGTWTQLPDITDRPVLSNTGINNQGTVVGSAYKSDQQGGGYSAQGPIRYSSGPWLRRNDRHQ
jgi:uncharacterized membrane protein